MTEPVKNVHYAIAGKPALQSSDNRYRTPYGKQVNPIGVFCHSNLLLSPHIALAQGFVNG